MALAVFAITHRNEDEVGWETVKHMDLNGTEHRVLSKKMAHKHVCQGESVVVEEYVSALVHL